MPKDPHYTKFLEQRAKHVFAADYFLEDLIKSAQRVQEYIRETPQGSDYYAMSTAFAEKHACTVALVMRELLSVRIAYETWKPGTGYPSLQ